MKKKNILFVLDHRLHGYRLGLFENLSKYYNITIIHRGPILSGNYDFDQKILVYKKILKFEYIKCLDYSGCDILVFMQNLRLINLYSFLFQRTRDFKLVLWGIGTSSSKKLGGENLLVNILRNIVTSRSDKIALYSSFPIYNYWISNRRKISVVGNSLSVPYSRNTSLDEKKNILFIGTLDKRKGVFQLVVAFFNLIKASSTIPSYVNLVIIGDGAEYEKILRFVKDNNLYNRVKVVGRVDDEKQKYLYFKSSFFVVSPLQAGLGVVEAFSYGVPFVTTKNAVTGGELLSIISDYNGVLMNDLSELQDVISSFFDSRRDCRSMGLNAYEFYLEHLAIDMFVDNFRNTIEN